MRGVIIHIIILLMLALLLLNFFAYKQYFYDGTHVPNYERLPNNITVYKYPDLSGELEIQNFKSTFNPGEYIADSYCFNKENNIFVLIKKDFKSRNRYYKYYECSYRLYSYDTPFSIIDKCEITKEEFDKLRENTSLTLIDNISYKNEYYSIWLVVICIFLTLLIALLVISCILTAFKLGKKRIMDAFSTIAIYSSLFFALIMMWVCCKQSLKYGNSTVICLTKSDISFSIQELSFPHNYEESKYLYRFIDRDGFDIISEGDYLTSCGITKIKSIRSYGRFGRSVLFSFVSSDEKEHFAIISKQGKSYITSEITKDHWRKLLHDNGIKIYSDFQKHSLEYQIKEFLLRLVIFYILIVVFPIYFIRRMFYCVS